MKWLLTKKISCVNKFSFIIIIIIILFYYFYKKIKKRKRIRLYSEFDLSRLFAFKRIELKIDYRLRIFSQHFRILSTHSPTFEASQQK